MWANNAEAVAKIILNNNSQIWEETLDQKKCDVKLLWHTNSDKEIYEIL